MSDIRGEVLIVDDNKVNRLLMARSVELLGHRATVAENGRCRNRGLVNIHIVHEVVKQVHYIVEGYTGRSPDESTTYTTHAVLDTILNDRLTTPGIDTTSALSLSSSPSSEIVIIDAKTPSLTAKHILRMLPNDWTKNAS